MSQNHGRRSRRKTIMSATAIGSLFLVGVATLADMAWGWQLPVLVPVDGIEAKMLQGDSAKFSAAYTHATVALAEFYLAAGCLSVVLLVILYGYRGYLRRAARRNRQSAEDE